MSLPGPSRTIVVEPLERPAEAPAPAVPAREPAERPPVAPEPAEPAAPARP